MIFLLSFLPSHLLFPLFHLCSFLCVILILFALFLLLCFLLVLYYIYTTLVPFHSFLSSFFCFLSFFIIIIILSFLSMCLCQFIWRFHYIISTFYCISFPFVLFCCSNFSLFSLLFLYTATIFSHSFSFSSNKLYILFTSWHTIMCPVASSSVLQRGHVVSVSFVVAFCVPHI